jgi:hypothetical protein
MNPRHAAALVLMGFSVLVLNGCASDANIYHSLVGQRVVGSDSYVTVSNVWNEMDGLPLADKHCAQYGKSARFTHMEDYRAIYDCVKP